MKRNIASILAGLAIATTSNASHAQQWIQRDVTDHLLGVVGTGIQVTGEIEDERGKARTGEFVINCSKNSTTMYIGSDRVFIGGRSSAVAWRADTGPVQRATWDICADNKCAGLWNGAGIPFVKSLFGKDRLLITIKRYDSQEIKGTFFIRGIETAVKPVGQLCGWIPKS